MRPIRTDARGGRLDPIVILVDDTEARSRARYAFLHSPVRIGRSEDGEVPLRHPFVSGRHGVVEFDDRQAAYTDLGSRNGSSVDGVPALPGVARPLRAGSEIQIGPLRIVVERVASPRAAEGAAPDLASEEPAMPPGVITALMERLARTSEPTVGETWAASLHPGLVIGRFELLREIGRGGFGVVYEARDRQLGRHVAFKAMRPAAHAASRLGESWLRREAEAAARLCHPNIVSLFDAGTWEGGPFLILELLRGETLAERLRRGPLPLDEGVRVGVDVARALAHAHSAGVLHRDLKPGNVFLTADGFTKVLDFGLAHLFGGGRFLAGGTPRYMALEQRRGEAQDARTDVFAAALVLGESLGGRVPEAGGPVELPGAPESLHRLLAAALAESPDRRPADGRVWLLGLVAAAQAGRPDVKGEP